MSVERYLRASTRENTRKAYRSAVEHFEVTWGGMLPTSSTELAKYLKDYAEVHTHSTLKLRLAALSRWHRDQGFHDPTKSPLVRGVMKGIKVEHPYRQKKAKPITIDFLARLDSWFRSAIDEASVRPRDIRLGRLLRDRALVSLGFWQALRSDDLCRISIEFTEFPSPGNMEIFLPRSKGDREADGRILKVQAVNLCCPVTACVEWLEYLGETEGPLLRGIDRWNNARQTQMNPNSVVLVLRKVLESAGLESAETFSSHSLRRGFANWAIHNAMDLKSLMEYVGWTDTNTALEYIDVTPPSFNEALERQLERDAGYLPVRKPRITRD